MQAVVLSVGSELLRGDIVDTNAAFLTRQLSQLGFEVRRVQQIGDVLEDLSAAFVQALADVDVVICSGGLGPTEDDLTRQAIGRALGEDPRCDESLVTEIAARFEAMGRTMPPSNRQQAMVIDSCEPIPNPNGTAPGWYVRKEGRVVAALPGPPGELQPMWDLSVQPRLARLLSGGTAMASLMTFGLGESTVEERIADVIHWRQDVTVATYAKTQGVEVHVTCRGASSQSAEAVLREAEEMLRLRLGDAVFGAGDDTLSSVSGRLLLKRGLKLAVMESCTGGQLSSAITDTSGSSEYFQGGIVAYTAKAKARYGVDRITMERHGLVSAETAISMARAARTTLEADVGLGVTGVAGDEPVEGHPPGTMFVAAASQWGEEVRTVRRPGRRDVVKHFGALSALDLLRRHLESARESHA